MPLELTVTTDFFASDFVPAVCLFSGKTEGVKSVQVRVTYDGGPARKWYQTGRDSSRAWNALFTVPAVPREHAAWSVWEIARIVCSVACFLFGGVMLSRLLNDVDLSTGVSGDLRGMVWTALLFFATGALAVAAWLQRKNNLLMVLAAAEKNHVLLRFPQRRAAVHVLYLAAWNSYQAAGSPPPTPKAKDEGWEDDAKPGWDEGGKA